MKYVALGCAVFLGLLILATAVPATSDVDSSRQRPTASPRSRTPTPSPPATPGGPRLTVIDPAHGWQLWCRQANPSCHTEPWWAEFEAQPMTSRCRYAFLPPGFVSDCALVEAVVLVGQWRDGRTLLEEAGDWGVTAIIAPQQVVGRSGTHAHYDASRKVIRISETYSQISTWMLAAILVHELTHSRQDRLHQLGPACQSTEQPAYQAEAEFVRWLTARMGSLPPRAAVAERLSTTDTATFDHLVRLATTPDLAGIVARICASPGHGVGAGG